MAKEKKDSYRDLYPQYAKYIVNPDTTDEWVETKNLFDIMVEWQKEEDSHLIEYYLEDFLSSTAKWYRSIRKFGDAERPAYENYDTADSTQNTQLLRDAIKSKLESTISQKEKYNFLLGIRKELAQGTDYLLGLRIDDETLLKFVVAEIDYLKDIIDVMSNDSEDDEIELQMNAIVNAGSTAGQKVLLLDEHGIIDFLNSKYNLKNNYTKISQILAPILGLKVDTIRQPLSAKKNNQKGNKNYPSQESIQEALDILALLKLPKEPS